MTQGPRILAFDIETAPAAAFVWKRWKENIRSEQVLQESFVLCAVGQFLDEKKPRTACAWGNPNDIQAVREIWQWLDEADIVVAHNGRKFDVPTMNARFALHGLPPPSPYKIVDTLLAARKHFKFPYNGLDALCDFLHLGRKQHTDFGLWKECMACKKEALERMLEYCKQDVVLLVKLYRILLPYMSSHPNHGLYQVGNGEATARVCPKCGSHHLQSRGFDVAPTGRYRRFKCMSCHGWSRQRTKTLSRDEKEAVLASI